LFLQAWLDSTTISLLQNNFYIYPNTMPNTSSAKKALRGSIKKQEVNSTRRNKLKNALKSFRQTLSTSPKDIQATFSNAFSALDKAVKSNLIPKGRANRKKARLAAQVSKAQGETEKKVIRVKTKAAQKAKVAKPKAVAKKVAPKAEAKPVVKKPVAKKAPAKK
jgi:ribosomal protein S20